LRRKTKATIDNSIVASSSSSTPVRAILLDLYERLIALLDSFSLIALPSVSHARGLMPVQVSRMLCHSVALQFCAISFTASTHAAA
jgi:hypothetical protein